MYLVFLLDGSLRYMLQLVSSPASVSFCSCLGSEPGSLLAMSGTVDGPCYQHLFLLAVFRSCGTVLHH